MPNLLHDRPHKMYRNGREEDQDFGQAELLYRRYLQEHWIDNCFSPAGFKFEEDSGHSVNRQKYSDPEYLFYFDDGTYDDEWGVLEFAVSDIPGRLPEVDTPAFVFFPKHVPKDLNFSHTEVWCDREANTGRYVRPSPTIRKLLRAKLSQRVRIKIEAQK